MDIGDIIFLIVMGLGFLTSLGGASRKKRQANRERGQTRQPSQPAAGQRTVGRVPQGQRKKSRIQEAREKAVSQMEELLREIEGVPRAPTTTPPSPPKPTAVVVESPDIVLTPPVPLAREMPPSVPPPRDGTLHKAFHDKYIRPVEGPKARSKNARSRQYLSPRSLREAVLLREILGRPKGLQ